MNQLVIGIHASSLDNYLDCPRRAVADKYPRILRDAGYEVRELEKYVTPFVGSGVHAGADHLNKEYIRSGLLPHARHVAEAAEIGFAKFNELIAKEMEHSDIQYPKLKFQNNDIIREHIAQYVQLYTEVVLPTRKLELTEQFFKVPLKDGYEYVSTLDAYGHGTLYDLKTGDKITPAYAQVGTYIYLLRNAGYVVHSAQLDYICKDKPSSPPQHKVIKYDADSCVEISQYATIRLMQDLEEFFESGDIKAFSINPRSEMCQQKFCRLWGTTSCGGWKKG